MIRWISARMSEESGDEATTLPPDSAAGLLSRLAVSAPAAGLSILLLGTAALLPAGATAAGLLVIIAVLAIRFVTRRYAADRTACIFVALVASLWILWHYASTGDDPGWAIVGTLVTALALLAVPPVTRVAAIHVPVISNLPGLKPAPEPWSRTLLLDLIALLAIGGGAVAAAAGAPSWVWAALSLVVAAHPGIGVVWTVRRLLAARVIDAAIDAAVADYAPEFYVYTARPDDASYQIHMWLPYLERTGRPFIIIARSNLAARAIIANTDVPVITRRSLGDLGRLIVPSLRAVFYVNASSGNGALVRYQQLTHVYLGHGDSDKPPSYNPTHAMYDKVFCAGPAAIDRYQAHGVDIPQGKFEIVGRPQVESVRPAGGDQIATVLYAPTWRGHVSETLLYSLPQGEQIVRALLARGLTVIFRPHPFSHEFPEDSATVRRLQNLLAADAATSGRQHLYGPAAETERSIVECINLSDAMVSDISGVVSDYLFSGKPFGLVAVTAPPDQFVQAFPVAAGSYVIDGQLTNLGDVLDLMLGADPRQDQRRAIRNYYLGDFPDHDYAQNFVDACVRVLATPLGEVGGVDDSVDESRARPTGFIERVRTNLSSYGREIVLSGVATASAVCALIEQSLAATVFGVVAVVGLVVVSRQGIRDRTRLTRMIGTLVLPQLTLLAAAAAIAEGPEPGTSLPQLLAVVTLSALVATTTAALALGPVWNGPGLGVRGLPGLAEPDPPRLPPGSAYAVTVGALAVSWLVLALSLPPVLVMVPAVAALVVSAVVLRASVRRAEALDRSRSELEQHLTAYGPRFAVYFGSSFGADYQVGMWLPYFHRIGPRFVIITRTLGMLNALSELDAGVPVIFRPTLRSLEEVIVPTLTTTFYVNNAVRNTHFIERRELTHVWLNHGDSEKPACFNPVHAIYDKIYAAGQAGIDRYARHGTDIARSKFEIVGRPQIERITAARGPIAALPDVTVLYAPTWRGPYADSQVYSLPMGERIVRALLERGVRVVFRAHPFNYRFSEARDAIQRIGRALDKDRRTSGRDHLWGPAAETAMTVEDCFNASDAMIADVSAVLSDYLKSSKPFSIVSVGRPPEQLLMDAPVAKASYILRDDLVNLSGVLDDLLGGDPLAAARAAMKVYYLGDFPDAGYADGFLNAARSTVAGSGGPHPIRSLGSSSTHE